MIPLRQERAGPVGCPQDNQTLWGRMAEVGKDEGLWTTKQVMGFLQVDEETVYRWVREGRINRVKVGARNRYRPDEIRAISERGLPNEGAA